MSIWVTPVTDRTLSDCENQTSKGSLGAADLNRIESNLQYLHDTLESLGYSNTIISSGLYPFDREKYITVDTINAYVQSLINLQSSFTTCPLDTLNPMTKDIALTYGYMNLLEEYIRQLNQYIDYISCWYTDEIGCGEV